MSLSSHIPVPKEQNLLDPELDIASSQFVEYPELVSRSKSRPSQNRQLCSPSGFFQVRRTARTRFEKQKFAQLRTSCGRS